MLLSFRTYLTPSLFVHILLPLILSSVVFDENLTFALLVLSFFCNPAYYKMLADDQMRVFLKRVFLLICAVIAVVVANGSLLAGTSLALIVEQHHRLFIFLLLGPVIADLTYVSLQQSRIDAFKIYRTFHLGLLVLILIKLVYVLVSGGFPSNLGLEAVTGRGSGFFSRNYNFYDDYSILLVCASVWTTRLAIQEWRAPHYTLLWLAPMITVVFFWNIIIFGESRGGWLGVIAMLVFTIAILFGFHRFKAVLLVVVLLVALTTMHWDRIVPEMTKSWPAVEKLIFGKQANGGQVGTTGNTQNQPTSVFPTDDNATTGVAPSPSNCEDGTVTYEDIAGSGKDLNITLRLAIYDFAFNAWLARPFLGYGAYDKRRLVKEIPAEDRCAVLFMDHPHNLYLHLGISGGLILLLPVVALACAPILLLGLAAWRKLPGALLYLPAAAFSVFFLVENLFGLNFTNLHLGVPISWLLMTVVSFAIIHANTLDKRQLDL